MTQLGWILTSTHSAPTELPVQRLHYCILVPAATKILVLSLESQPQHYVKDQGDHRLLSLATATPTSTSFLEGTVLKVPFKFSCCFTWA